MLINNYKNKIARLFKHVRRKRRKVPQDTSLKSYDQPKKLPINRRHIFLFFLILGTFLVAFYIIPFVFNFIRLDFSKGYGDTKKPNDITYSSKINIILIGTDEYNNDYRFIDALALLSYDYNSKEMGIFSINPDLQVTLTGLNKQIELRRLLNFASIKGSETDYLVSGLESLLAIKIDRYVYINKEGFSQMSNSLPGVSLKLNANLKDSNTINLPQGKALDLKSGQITLNNSDMLAVFASDANGKDDKLDRQTNIMIGLIKSLKNFKLLTNMNQFWLESIANVKTNMTKLEMLKLFYDLTYIRDDMIKKGFTRSASYHQILSTNIYGSYTVNQERLDKDISSIFFNLDVFKEQAKIELFNASGVRGLASNRYRWVVNMGGNVVKISNSDSFIDEVYIYCDQPAKYEKTLNELKKMFSGQAVVKNEKYYNRQIGDMVVVIGKNYR